MGKKLLVPFDGSEPAARALEFALETFPEAAIMCVYVVETGWGPFAQEDPPEWDILGDDLSGLYDEREARGRKILETAESIASESDREIETVIEFGKIDRNILGSAKHNDIDHIVIGSHSRSGVDRILLGSVAEKVARRAELPVTIIR